MIHYAVRCGAGHEFDGWFRDSAAFDRQVAGGLLPCPTCGSTSVGRALMAPSVRTSKAPSPATAPEPPRPAAVGGAPLPDEVRAQLQRLRAAVEKNCDYVGPGFADEARRMHTGESEHRGIYGEATPSEAESLAEEGIEVASIPWLPRAEG